MNKIFSYILLITFLLTGKELFAQKFLDKTIDVSGLSDGTCFSSDITNRNVFGDNISLLSGFKFDSKNASLSIEFFDYNVQLANNPIEVVVQFAEQDEITILVAQDQFEKPSFVLNLSSYYQLYLTSKFNFPVTLPLNNFYFKIKSLKINGNCIDYKAKVHFNARVIKPMTVNHSGYSLNIPNSGIDLPLYSFLDINLTTPLFTTGYYLDYYDGYDVEWTFLDDFDNVKDTIHKVSLKEGFFKFKESVYNSEFIVSNTNTKILLSIPLIKQGNVLLYRVSPFYFDESNVKIHVAVPQSVIVNHDNLNPEEDRSGIKVYPFNPKIRTIFIKEFTDEDQDRVNSSVVLNFTDNSGIKSGYTFKDGFGKVLENKVLESFNTGNLVVKVQTPIYDAFDRSVGSFLPYAQSLTNRIISYQSSNSYPSLSEVNGSVSTSTPELTPSLITDAFSSATFCGFNPFRVHKDNGVGKYYSSSTDFTTTVNRSFVPSAITNSGGVFNFNSPYALSGFTFDRTGRKRFDYAPGFSDSKNGLTSYYYSTVAQEELDRHFGSDAGFADFYSKKVTKDPNGLFTTTIMDVKGNIVLSGISANTKEAYLPLSSSPTSSAPIQRFTLLNDNFRSSITPPNFITGVKSNLFPLVFDKDISQFNVNYLIDINPYRESKCATPTEVVCYPCEYEFELKLLNDCVDNNFLKTSTKAVFAKLPEDCNSLSGAINVDDANNSPLAAGQYELVKELKLKETAIAAALSKYEVQGYGNCSTSFTNQLTGLDIVCEEDPDPNAILNPEQFNELQNEAFLESYLVDVSPGGQYGATSDKYVTSTQNENGRIEDQFLDHRISVFYDRFKTTPNRDNIILTRSTLNESFVSDLRVLNFSLYNSTDSPLDLVYKNTFVAAVTPTDKFNELKQFWRYPDYYGIPKYIAENEEVRNEILASFPSDLNSIFKNNTSRQFNYTDVSGTIITAPIKFIKDPDNDELWIAEDDLLVSLDVTYQLFLNLAPPKDLETEITINLPIKYLRNVDDFLKYWQPHFAKYLVKYHPEYYNLYLNSKLSELDNLITEFSQMSKPTSGSSQSGSFAISSSGNCIEDDNYGINIRFNDPNHSYNGTELFKCFGTVIGDLNGNIVNKFTTVNGTCIGLYVLSTISNEMSGSLCGGNDQVSLNDIFQDDQKFEFFKAIYLKQLRSIRSFHYEKVIKDLPSGTDISGCFKNSEDQFGVSDVVRAPASLNTKGCSTTATLSNRISGLVDSEFNGVFLKLVSRSNPNNQIDDELSATDLCGTMSSYTNPLDKPEIEDYVDNIAGYEADYVNYLASLIPNQNICDEYISNLLKALERRADIAIYRNCGQCPDVKDAELLVKSIFPTSGTSLTWDCLKYNSLPSSVKDKFKTAFPSSYFDERLNHTLSFNLEFVNEGATANLYLTSTTTLLCSLNFIDPSNQYNNRNFQQLHTQDRIIEICCFAASDQSDGFTAKLKVLIDENDPNFIVGGPDEQFVYVDIIGTMALVGFNFQSCNLQCSNEGADRTAITNFINSLEFISKEIKFITISPPPFPSDWNLEYGNSQLNEVGYSSKYTLIRDALDGIINSSINPEQAKIDVDNFCLRYYLLAKESFRKDNVNYVCDITSPYRIFKECVFKGERIETGFYAENGQSFRYLRIIDGPQNDDKVLFEVKTHIDNSFHDVGFGLYENSLINCCRNVITSSADPCQGVRVAGNTLSGVDILYYPGIKFCLNPYFSNSNIDNCNKFNEGFDSNGQSDFSYYFKDQVCDDCDGFKVSKLDLGALPIQSFQKVDDGSRAVTSFPEYARSFKGIVNHTYSSTFLDVPTSIVALPQTVKTTLIGLLNNNGIYGFLTGTLTGTQFEPSSTESNRIPISFGIESYSLFLLPSDWHNFYAQENSTSIKIIEVKWHKLIANALTITVNNGQQVVDVVGYIKEESTLETWDYTAPLNEVRTFLNVPRNPSVLNYFINAIATVNGDYSEISSSFKQIFKFSEAASDVKVVYDSKDYYILNSNNEFNLSNLKSISSSTPYFEVFENVSDGKYYFYLNGKFEVLLSNGTKATVEHPVLVYTTNSELSSVSKRFLEANFMCCPQLNNILIPALPEPIECEGFAVGGIMHNPEIAQYISNADKQEALNQFKVRYIKHCLSQKETLSVSYNGSLYQTTLYYYDQAGNLVRTIPPKGVALLPEDKLSTVATDRLAGRKSVFTNHNLASTYNYNSLQKKIGEQNPDQESMNLVQYPKGSSIIEPVNFNSNTEVSIINPKFILSAAVSETNNHYLYQTSDLGKNWTLANFEEPVNYNGYVTKTVVNGTATTNTKYVFGDNGYFAIFDQSDNSYGTLQKLDFQYKCNLVAGRVLTLDQLDGMPLSDPNDLFGTNLLLHDSEGNSYLIRFLIEYNKESIDKFRCYELSRDYSVSNSAGKFIDFQSDELTHTSLVGTESITMNLLTGIGVNSEKASLIQIDKLGKLTTDLQMGKLGRSIRINDILFDNDQLTVLTNRGGVYHYLHSREILAKNETINIDRSIIGFDGSITDVNYVVADQPVKVDGGALVDNGDYSIFAKIDGRDNFSQVNYYEDILTDPQVNPVANEVPIYTHKAFTGVTARNLAFSIVTVDDVCTLKIVSFKENYGFPRVVLPENGPLILPDFDYSRMDLVKVLNTSNFHFVVTYPKVTDNTLNFIRFSINLAGNFIGVPSSPELVAGVQDLSYCSTTTLKVDSYRNYDIDDLDKQILAGILVSTPESCTSTGLNTTKLLLYLWNNLANTFTQVLPDQQAHANIPYSFKIKSSRLQSNNPSISVTSSVVVDVFESNIDLLSFTPPTSTDGQQDSPIKRAPLTLKLIINREILGTSITYPVSTELLDIDNDLVEELEFHDYYRSYNGKFPLGFTPDIFKAKSDRTVLVADSKTNEIYLVYHTGITLNLSEKFEVTKPNSVKLFPIVTNAETGIKSLEGVVSLNSGYYAVVKSEAKSIANPVTESATTSIHSRRTAKLDKPSITIERLYDSDPLNQSFYKSADFYISDVIKDLCPTSYSSSLCTLARANPNIDYTNKAAIFFSKNSAIRTLLGYSQQGVSVGGTMVPLFNLPAAHTLKLFNLPSNVSITNKVFAISDWKEYFFASNNNNIYKVNFESGLAPSTSTCTNCTASSYPLASVSNNIGNTFKFAVPIPDATGSYHFLGSGNLTGKVLAATPYRLDVKKKGSMTRSELNAIAPLPNNAGVVIFPKIEIDDITIGTPPNEKIYYDFKYHFTQDNGKNWSDKKFRFTDQILANSFNNQTPYSFIHSDYSATIITNKGVIEVDDITKDIASGSGSTFASPISNFTVVKAFKINNENYILAGNNGTASAFYKVSKVENHFVASHWAPSSGDPIAGPMISASITGINTIVLNTDYGIQKITISNTLEGSSKSIDFAIDDLTLIDANKIKSIVAVDDLKWYLYVENNNAAELHLTTNGGYNWTKIDKSATNSTDDISSVLGTPPLSFDATSEGNIMLSASGGKSLFVTDKSQKYTARYFYDEAGRLVLSQNQKQLTNSRVPKYSYMLYDGLGRVYESGEATFDHASFENEGLLSQKAWQSGIIEAAEFNALFNNKKIKKDYTVNTYYDKVPDLVEEFALPNNPNFKQTNLTNRVAVVVSKQAFTDPNPTSSADKKYFTSVTRYAYDVPGNVKQLDVTYLYQLPGIDGSLPSGNFKNNYLLSYNFDELTGKVNTVTYNKGKVGQFFHKYTYDAEGKLLEVFTSIDSTIWIKEAKYLYYPHGPLARVELGENNVQGLDYYYTLQGWLKGVNSANLNPENDPGKDGFGTSAFAPDVVGYNLKYYDGDYDPIGSFAATNPITAAKRPDLQGIPTLTSTTTTTVGTNTETTINGFRNLYNGNIAAMVTSHSVNNKPNSRLGIYQYDELNRIRKTQNKVLGYSDLTSNTVHLNTSTPWANNTPWNEDFTYDANGNIETLTRNDETGSIMDNLTYSYPVSNFANKPTNRLNKVVDNTDKTGFDDFRPGQANDNYLYDASGNLRKDAQEQLDQIIWTPANKMEFLKKVVGDETIYNYRVYDGTGQLVLKWATKFVGTSTTETPVNGEEYVRDPQGNVMATYQLNATGARTLTEQTIYGSSRLGTFTSNTTILAGASDVLPTTPTIYSKYGNRKYEISNHLGNVLAVVSDEKDANGKAKVLDRQDYYAFGSPLPKFAIDQLAPYTYRHNCTPPNPRNGLNHLILPQDNACNPSSSETVIVGSLGTVTLNIDIIPNAKYKLSFDVEWPVNCTTAACQTLKITNPIPNANFVTPQLVAHSITNVANSRLENYEFTGSTSFTPGTKLVVTFPSSGAKLSNIKLEVDANPVVNGVASPVFYDLANATFTNLNAQGYFTHTSTANGCEQITTEGCEQTEGIKLRNNAILRRVFNNFVPGRTYKASVTIKADSYDEAIADAQNTNFGTAILILRHQALPIYWSQPKKQYKNSDNNYVFEVTFTPQDREYVLVVQAPKNGVTLKNNHILGIKIEQVVFEGESEDYRYGFNGKEKENTLYNSSNAYDFGARLYDSRIGRWFGVDPLNQQYPDISPYTFVANNPFYLIDPDGAKIRIHYVENGVSKYCDYTPGIKPTTSNKFVQQVHEAASAVMKNDQNKTFQNLAKADKVATIYEISNDNDRTETYQYADGTTAFCNIYWNPMSALLTTNGEGQAPSTGLLHEASHALRDISATTEQDYLSIEKDSYDNPSDYDNNEEKRVIDKVETPFIISNNQNSKGIPFMTKQKEGTRNDHRGETYISIGVNSITPSNPIELASRTGKSIPNTSQSTIKPSLVQPADNTKVNNKQIILK